MFFCHISSIFFSANLENTAQKNSLSFFFFSTAAFAKIDVIFHSCFKSLCTLKVFSCCPVQQHMELQPRRKYLAKKGTMTINPNNEISAQMDI